MSSYNIIGKQKEQVESALLRNLSIIKTQDRGDSRHAHFLIWKWRVPLYYTS